MAKKNMFGAVATAAVDPDELSGGEPARVDQEQAKRTTTTIRLDVDTIKAVKMRAAAEGIRPNAVMEKAILKYLEG